MVGTSAGIGVVEQRADRLDAVDEEQHLRPLDSRGSAAGCHLLDQPVDEADGPQRVRTSHRCPGVREPAGVRGKGPAAGVQDVDVQRVGVQGPARLSEDGAQGRAAATANSADDQPGAPLGEVELEGRLGLPVGEVDQSDVHDPATR
jgi:hypothetical protein